LTFCGQEIIVTFDKQGFSCRETFRRFDDGYYKLLDISSRQNNVVKSVITAKKSWGLHLKMWCEGIAEGTFTKNEILEIFSEKGIIIPEQLLKEFENLVYKKRIEYYERNNC